MERTDHMELTDPREDLAKHVSDRWFRMNTERIAWFDRGLEARKYVTAPDTKHTEVGTLPWKNKTTIPKLTQIVDGLQSYYMAALMPSDDWFIWEGRDLASQEKANLIEEYMRTKLRMSKFRSELEKVVRDWVLYGNCYAGVTWVNDTTTDIDGSEIVNYVGPKFFRISPLDCVVDPRATTFRNSPFVQRSIISIVDLLGTNDQKGEGYFNQEAVDEIKTVRKGGPRREDFVDFYKRTGLEIDGFNTIDDYLASGYIEILEYWGDYYIESTGEVVQNQHIVIADGAWTLRQVDNAAWNGEKPFAMTTWRVLPDNLYGQSPIDNLIGMQYRCDHLENAKADIIDQIIHPVVVVKGDSFEDYIWGPGQRWNVPADGDVTALRPDATALSVDSQIAQYHSYMEQIAALPREAMGFRSPGEKTAFEVSALQQGADRQFIDKVNHFEEHMIEPMLNLMFELIIRNLDITDVARTFNDDTKALALTELTREDVVADGVLRPIGAKHFSARAKRIQELSTFLQIAQTPTIAPHISGVRAAEMFSEELGWDKFNIVEAGVATKEAAAVQAQAIFWQQEFAKTLGGPPDEGEPEQQPT